MTLKVSVSSCLCRNFLTVMRTYFLLRASPSPVTITFLPSVRTSPPVFSLRKSDSFSIILPSPLSSEALTFISTISCFTSINRLSGLCCFLVVCYLDKFSALIVCQTEYYWVVSTNTNYCLTTLVCLSVRPSSYFIAYALALVLIIQPLKHRRNISLLCSIF